MNTKTKVNGFLLERRMDKAGIKEFSSRRNIEEVNEGNAFKETKILSWMTICSLAIGIALNHMNAPIPVSIACFLVSALGMFAAHKVYCRERHARDAWDAIATKVYNDKAAFNAVFPEFGKIAKTAGIFKEDNDSFHYCVDWARAQILRLVIQIENGDESMRGELRVKFLIAKNLFGDYIDHDRGYDYYFSRHILEQMTYHKEGFSLPAVVMSPSTR